MAVHTPIIAATVAPWHETPDASTFIAAIDLDELFLDRPMVVMGDDLLHYTGDPVEKLRDIRRACVDAQFGCSYREACNAGRGYEYLDLEATMPTVDQALAAHLVDPRRYGNEDPDRATLMMRFEVRQKAALDRRAA